MDQRYEENFFEVLYKDRVGKFTKDDLDRNMRWFWTWINLIKNNVTFKEGRVLEIGCAIGGASAVIKDLGFDVCATDVSSYVIRRSKKIRPDINYSVLDINKRISINGMFDYIIAFEVLEHLENPIEAIFNVRLKLKRGGWFIFSTPPPYRRFTETPTHINVHSERYWKRLLEKSGFKKENTIVKKATFLPVLYRYSKYLNVALPFNLDIPMLSSTIFYFSRKT